MVIIVLALVIALGFANTSAAAIPKITTSQKSWKDVPELKSAHSYLTWLSVAGWITIALIITGIVLFFVFGGEFVEGAEEAEQVEKKLTKKKKGGSFMLDAVLFLAGGITITIGIISALAASNLRRAQANADNGIEAGDKYYSKAYDDAIIAASLGIGTIGLLILVMIIHASAKHAAKTSQLKKEEAQKKKIENAKKEKIRERQEAEEERREERKDRQEELKEERDEAAAERKLQLQEKQAELKQRQSQLESKPTVVA